MGFLDRLKQALPQLSFLLALFFGTRLMLTLIAVFTRSILGHKSPIKFGVTQYPWLNIWGEADTFWYIDIAKNGYSSHTNLLGQGNYAFFPLYPMLIKFLGAATGNKYYLAGLLISNFSLIFACIFLYKLVNQTSNQRIALNTIKYLFLSPTAFILSGVFTESLYLFLTVVIFYFTYKRNWILVGVVGFFVALTRNLGVLLIIPLLFEYLKEIHFDVKKIRLDIIFLFLIPLGLILYSFYNYHLTGDFLAFKTVQTAWGRSFSNPFHVVVHGLYKAFYQSNIRNYLDASIALISLAILCIFYKKIGFSYWLFGMYSILIPLSTELESMPRYILPIFPIYIILAKLGEDHSFDQVTTIFLGLLQGFLMVFWSSGYPLIV
ncbi:MAG: hypothetical protein KME16_12055 [Scytolyngbya sp. HA4215-MV1]|jgi:hypothetical protein|nr:hypothetical protein [Scytolyngbya sp. HA4215-MV1]